MIHDPEKRMTNVLVLTRIDSARHGIAIVTLFLERIAMALLPLGRRHGVEIAPIAVLEP